MLLSAMRRDFIRFDLIEFLWFKTLLSSKVVADELPTSSCHPSWIPFPLSAPPPLALLSATGSRSSVRDLRVLFMF